MPHTLVAYATNPPKLAHVHRLSHTAVARIYPPSTNIGNAVSLAFYAPSHDPLFADAFLKYLPVFPRGSPGPDGLSSVSLLAK